MLPPRKIAQAFYQAARNTLDHDGIEHAGYLAFLGLLALFPFLVFVFALAGLLSAGQAGDHFVRLILAMLPAEMVSSLSPHIHEIVSGPPQGLLTISILGALWTSSSAVDGYRNILNRAYHVQNSPSYLWCRMISIAQTLVLSFLVVMAMLALVVLPLVWEKIEAAFGAENLALTNHEVIFLALITVFLGVSVAYYFLPNLKQSIHAVAPGAALVTLLWIESAHLLSLYLLHFGRLNLIYGSLGSVIATLMFFYVNNIIFIYGAELNYLLKLAHGEKIEQKEQGKPAEPDKIEQK